MEMTGVLSEATMALIEGRGLDIETASRLGLETAKSERGEVLIFPFYREGRLVNRKYRPLGEKKFWQDSQEKGAIKCLWNEDVLRDDTLLDEPLIITEGEFDAMAAIDAGFPRAVSVPDGAPAEKVTDKAALKYNWLDDVDALLKLDRVPEIILAVDNDDQGANLLHDLANRLTRARCKFLQWPLKKDGTGRHKDLNDVLRDYGVKGVRATIETAQFMIVEGVARMADLPPLPPLRIYNNGFNGLEHTMRIALGYVSVWTGIPGHGKSTFLNDLMCRLAVNHDLKVCFASFEQMPQRDHRRNLRSWHGWNHEDKLTHEKLEAADHWINTTFTFITPVDDEDTTLDWLLDRMEAAVIQHNCSIFVIDPWDELDHDYDPRGETETQYITRAIKMLKRFAMRMQVHIAIVSHPQKQRKRDDGTYTVPTLYDISGSARWYNKPDLGVIVHREGMTTSEGAGSMPSETGTLLRIQKSRYHDLFGPPADVMLKFDFPTRRYEVEKSPLDQPDGGF